MGEAFKRGIELYGDQQPQGARRLEIIYEDHRYDGKTVVTAMNKLLEVDHAEVLIVWGNTPSGVAAPLAERRRVPTLVISMNPDAAGRSYVVSFGSRSELLVARIAKFYQQAGARKPGVVSVDLGSALQAIKMLRDSLQGNLVEEIVATEEQDFKTIILGLKRRQVDALLLFALPNQAITFARQARDLGYLVPIIGGDIFADSKFAKEFEMQLPELAFAYGAVKLDFVDALEEKFKRSSYFYESACGYTTAALLANLARAEDGSPGIDFFERLRKAGRSEVPVRGLVFQEDAEYGRHITNDVAVYRLKDGKWHAEVSQ